MKKWSKFKKAVTALSLTACMLCAGFNASAFVNADRLGTNHWFLDTMGLWLGSLPDAKLYYNTYQTPDTLTFGVSADSKGLVIMDMADLETDAAVGLSSDPNLTLLSSDLSNYIQFFNDGTNGVIDVKTGVVSFPDGISFGGFVTTGNVDFNGYKLILDADADTSITADTDDQIDIEISGADDFVITANLLTASSGSAISSALYESLNAGSTVTFAGLGGAANDENLVYDFETVADQVGVSSTTGVVDVEFGLIGLNALNYDGVVIASGANTFSATVGTASIDIAATSALDVNANLTVELASAINQDLTTDADVGFASSTMTGDMASLTVTSATLYSASGGNTITMAGLAGAANDENLIYNFETVADQVGVSSGTGVVDIEFGLIGLNALDYDGVVIASGANTFSATVGTASLDIAATSVLNVDANLTVEAASLINQDVTSDAAVNFASAILTGDMASLTVTSATLYSASGGNTITMAGLAGAANDENLIYNFEAVADQVGVSSGTGVVDVEFGLIGLNALDYDGIVLASGANTFSATVGTASLDIAAGSALNVDANLSVETASAINQDLTTDAAVGFASATMTGDVAALSVTSATLYTASAGSTITMQGFGGATNNEDLAYDFETVANQVGVSSSTGVVDIEFGTIGLNALDYDGVVIASGANTFSATVGTASLDIAAGSTLDVDANLSVETASAINQDLTTDANVEFAGLGLTSTFSSTAVGDLGWSVVAGANQACTTTCTNAAVFGFDDSTTTIVSASNAIADKCVCAGSN